MCNANLNTLLHRIKTTKKILDEHLKKCAIMDCNCDACDAYYRSYMRVIHEYNSAKPLSQVFKLSRDSWL